MAGAKSGVHVVQLKTISVPKSLQDGNKFVKWDDDSNTLGTPVTLRVDKKGFFLYWTDQNQETELLEISSIRDVRTGKYARVPREGRLRDSVTMGAPDTPLEDKTITVVYGPDLVNVSYFNFCTNCREVAQEWTDELLKMAYNLLALNMSNALFAEKAYTRLTLETDRDGRIPVKSVYRMFAQHKDDKKRVERALEAIGFSGGKNDVINPDKFNLDTYFSFLQYLTVRGEVEKIFEHLCGGKKKTMTVDQLVDFLNKEQRDPRLNEILYPYANHARGMDILKQYEPNKQYAQKGFLSVDGFLRYLVSDDNMIVTPEKFDLNMDMDQPLSHYFVNSSHNTYLTGHQLTGRSSVEIYRQCLLTGCRCVELDCWNGKNSDEEPIITHGYTVVTDILLKEVLEAIAECAFKTSSYPVILSFENHCSPKQQAKIASHCHRIFGDMLLTEPVPSHPLKPGQLLPSPQSLMRKIIIKNKKKHYPKAQNKPGEPSMDDDDDSSSCMPLTPERLKAELPGDDAADTGGSSDEGGGGMGEHVDPVFTAPVAAASTASTNQSFPSEKAASPSDESETDSVSDDEEAVDRPSEDQNEVDGTAAKESEAGAEMSALVNYIQPVRFHSFEYAEKRNRSYEVSSFVETHATSLLKEHPVEFVNYNKRQLSRIYPKGTRVDSSNYMPQVFWNAGCQMVALNFQSLDLGMQLNLGIFEYNARSGYLLKPDFMRRHDRKFDPFTESTVDGIIAGTVQIKIISGQFLTDKRVGTYVEVDMYGLPTDTVRRRFRTKTIPGNAINPVYDEEPFIFKKVVLPDLAVLRFAVYDDSNKFIGHRILPVVGLRPGYRHISLRNECGQPLTLPSLFVHITVKDYVPDGLSDFADALVNPIAYQSMVEKHANQLLALTDDFESEEIFPQHSGLVNPFCMSANENKKPKSQDTTDLARRPEDKGRVSVSRSDEETGIGGAVVRAAGGQGSIKPTSMNGSVHRPSAAGSTSPIPVTALTRTDTVHKRHNQSVRSLSDDGALEKAPNLLESAEADIAAEPLEKIKEHKLVLKVTCKLERDLQALRKKHEKIREREKELQQQKEEKLMKARESQKTQLVKTHSKLAKKCSAAEAQVLKRKSEVDMQVMGAEHQTKLQDLNRSYCQAMQALSKEQLKLELEFREKYQEQVYAAVEKALQLSQSAQLEVLKSLHDREVNELMKRLEAQTKEEMRDLGKKHKDKNELARIKRELNQKLIDQAVAERQKIMGMLDRKMADLKRQHMDIKKRFEDEKSGSRDKLRLEFEQQCAQVAEEYQINPNLATTPIMENPESEKL